MLFRRKQQKNRKRHHAWLYSVVFGGRLSTLAILFLFTSFLIQPFHKAIAAEPLPEETAEQAPVAEDVRPQEESPPEPSPPVEESPPPEESTIESPSEPGPDTGDLSVPDFPPDEAPDNNPSQEGDDLSPPEPEIPPESESPSDDDVDVPDTNTEELEETLEEAEDQVPATSTEMVVRVEPLVSEENFYQFSKQSCVAVGEGAYHCTNKDVSEIDLQSVAYAERGEDGNMEIFLRTSKGKVKQLTDNTFDDTSPHYDAESMRVVWQRLIDGRQQIILFDIMEDEEAQLTFSKTNNMEPKVSDAGIVWQAWDENDWEIMLFDGTYTEQLTENEAQDVAPVIQDGYVLWNVLGGDEQQARVYSLDTKETTSIVGHEGGSIINPRFVLVYDTQFDNGDVVTQSFDPSTGLSEPIAAKPAPEPVNIPQTDPTGEIRALITNKSQKDELEVGSDVPNADDTNASSTDSTPGTLNLAGASSSAPTADIAPVIPEFTPIELTEYDLVIPPTAFADALSEADASTQE